jgi:hypothetical protein
VVVVEDAESAYYCSEHSLVGVGDALLDTVEASAPESVLPSPASASLDRRKHMCMWASQLIALREVHADNELRGLEPVRAQSSMHILYRTSARGDSA